MNHFCFLGEKTHRSTERLTLLSELGIMVSVIHEPNLDPDARTVMGLLTPVSLPQPGVKEAEEVKEMHIHKLYTNTHICSITFGFNLTYAHIIFK